MANVQLSVRQLTGAELFFIKLQFGINAGMRERIYEKIGKFIKNGVPITQALNTMYTHLSYDGKKPNAVGAIVIDQWRRSVMNGQTFARAIEPWVPSGDLSVIEAGELSGKLDQAMSDVIFMNQANKKIKGALWGVAYPVFLVAILIFYLMIFGLKVVPAFSQILPADKWVGVGHTMAIMANFVQHKLLYWIIGVLAVIFVIVATMGILDGKLRVFLDKIPPWSIYRLMYGCNFLVALAALLGAGVAMPDALGIMSRAGSRWYRTRVSATQRIVLNGALNIGEALKKTGYEFPDIEMIIDIQSYASLDGFEEMLGKMAKQWLDDTVLKIESQVGILKNVALIGLAGVFTWLIGGVFALQNQISSSVTK